MKTFFEDINPAKNIDQKDEKPFGNLEEEKKKENELEKYQKEAQDFIDSHRRLLTTFAKDISLSFKISDDFFINLEKGEVNLDAKWFADKNCSKEQILWGCFHELEHFRDLDADSEGVMKNFEHIKKQAKKTGAEILKKWEEKYGASNPEFVENLKKQKPLNPKKPEKGTMNAVEISAYKIHHTFYNIFDDINDNNNVARKAAAFEKEAEGGREISRLYQEKLFQETDYSKLPRHLQFIYKLIREEMVSDEEVILSEEISEIMERKIKFQGKEFTPKEIVENFVKPRKNRDTLASQRHFALQKTLEPIFEELLARDLSEWDPQKPEKQDGQSQPGEGGESSGNPFEENYEDYDKNSPDQISEEDIKDWMNKNNEEKEKKEAAKAEQEKQKNKTAQEKADEAQDKDDKNWCEKNGISEMDFRNFKKIENEVEPYLKELSQLWQKIIYGSSRKLERETQGHFKTGTEMDVQKVIEEWPKIAKKKFENVRVMKRTVSKETLVEMPEFIRIRLVGDMSGSMDQEKIRILQQCFVLILSSVREFNTYLNLTRPQTKSKLEADAEGWIFGDEAEKIKKLRSESGQSYNDEQIEIIKAFEKLSKTIGGTYDNEALKKIRESLSAKDLENISNKKIMEIVFEITDGGSSNAEEARNEVDKLIERNIIARAFQIGEVSEGEKNTFNSVWNDGREDKRGEMVGEEIANLIPAITSALKKYLSSVKL